MKVAIEGCCHGELDKIYETIDFIQKKDNIKIDLLLICGDFQAVRNVSDLKTMAVPPKYQKMNTFWKYYKGEKKAPVLTVFIGGNHEASNFLQELPYGGWVAPNIYYMGYANVLQFGGLRIGGMSGIWKGRDYHKGHYEHPPYTDETKRSVYHVRSLEVFRLKQIKKPIDIFLSHDWPRGVYNYGNKTALLRTKKYFREEVEQGILGSPVAEEIMKHIKPSYWFSAHLHVKFAALIPHQGTNESAVTKFLALDKCLPRRKFLQVIDVQSTGPMELQLDPEWLCILKSTNHLMGLNRSNHYMPGPGYDKRHDYSVTEDDLSSLNEDFEGLYKIPENFQHTATPYDPNNHNKKAPDPQMMLNPQTSLLCEMLSLTNPYAVFMGKESHSCDYENKNDSVSETTVDKEDDDVLSDDENTSFIDTTLDMTVDTSQDTSVLTNNPDEISLDDIEDHDVSQVDMSITEMCNRQCTTDIQPDKCSTDIQPEKCTTDKQPDKCTTDKQSDNTLFTEKKLNTTVDPSDPLSLNDKCGAKDNCKVGSGDSLDSGVIISKEQFLSEPALGCSTPAACGMPHSPHTPIGKRSSDDSDPNNSPIKSSTQLQTGPSKAKKFKRRNIAMYSSTEDDSST